MISCVSFTGAPTSISNVASERRSVCQPMRSVMPARFAAGHTTLRMSESCQYGCFPPIFGLGNIQSVGSLYSVRLRSQDESGDAGGNDRHHPVESQFLHE